MKYTFTSLIMIFLGVLGLVIIVMFEAITLNNDSEYYVLKEAIEASMIEAIDYDCYRIATTVNNKSCEGNLKISEQKFVENFTRRFFASVSGDATDYEIEFYDIIEMPPKATVVIKSKTQRYSFLSSDTSDGSFKIVNNLTGILEFNSKGATIFSSVQSDEVPSVEQSADGSRYDGSVYNEVIEPDNSGEPDGIIEEGIDQNDLSEEGEVSDGVLDESGFGDDIVLFGDN